MHVSALLTFVALPLLALAQQALKTDVYEFPKEMLIMEDYDSVRASGEKFVFTATKNSSLDFGPRNSRYFKALQVNLIKLSDGGFAMRLLPVERPNTPGPHWLGTSASDCLREKSALTVGDPLKASRFDIVPAGNGQRGFIIQERTSGMVLARNPKGRNRFPGMTSIRVEPFKDGEAAQVWDLTAAAPSATSSDANTKFVEENIPFANQALCEKTTKQPSLINRPSTPAPSKAVSLPQDFRPAPLTADVKAYRLALWTSDSCKFVVPSKVNSLFSTSQNATGLQNWYQIGYDAKTRKSTFMSLQLYNEDRNGANKIQGGDASKFLTPAEKPTVYEIREQSPGSNKFYIVHPKSGEVWSRQATGGCATGTLSLKPIEKQDGTTWNQLFSFQPLRSQMKQQPKPPRRIVSN